MPSVRVRVTAGVGAWIVGAATATGLSLFAVSYLSTDPQSPQGATLSQDQVKQALASMTETAGSSTPPVTPGSPGSSDFPGSATTGPAPSAPTATTQPKPSAPAASAAPTHSAPVPQPVERRLSEDAGTVVAQCQGSMAYLVTWSPAQGYQAEVSQRGPAHLATVVFTRYGTHVEFRVGCPGGIPALVEGDDGRIDS